MTYKNTFLIKTSHINDLKKEFSMDEIAELICGISSFVETREEPDFTDRALRMEFRRWKEFWDYGEQKKEDARRRKEEQRAREAEESQMSQMSQMSQDVTDVTNIAIANAKANAISKANANAKDNINNIGDKSPKTSPSRFQRPSLDEIKQYIKDMHYTSNAEQIFNYYESNGWKVGRNPMKDWKAAVRNWESNEKRGSYKKRISDINEREYERGQIDMDLNDPTAMF